MFYRILSVVLLFGLTLGCSPKNQGTLSPEQVQSARAHPIGLTWTDEAGNKWTWLDAVHLQRVDIGKITVVYICDWPMGAYGPPSPGHCWEDGTGCVDPLPEPSGSIKAAGDNDGIVLK